MHVLVTSFFLLEILAFYAFFPCHIPVDKIGSTIKYFDAAWLNASKYNLLPELSFPPTQAKDRSSYK